MTYHRVVAKFGTSLLTSESERLDLEAMSGFVDQVVSLMEQNVEVIVVTSGARAAGRHYLQDRLGSEQKPSRQALASVGQGHLFKAWQDLFEQHNKTTAQVLLTRRDLANRLGYLNARTTLRNLLDCDIVPIINENDAVALDKLLAVDFGENDMLASLVSHLVDADLLAILTDVDGLFNGDPKKNSNVSLISEVSSFENLEAVIGGGDGNGGMAAKIDAARIAVQGGVSTIICNGRPSAALRNAVSGHPVGTFFPAPDSRLESRKQWILGNALPSASIVVDVGAASALREKGSSLLPAGIKSVIGEFGRGEPILIADDRQQQIAAGITNYASSEVERISGLKSSQIVESLGYTYGEEVVHRDNLVLF